MRLRQTNPLHLHLQTTLKTPLRFTEFHLNGTPYSLGGSAIATKPWWQIKAPEGVKYKKPQVERSETWGKSNPNDSDLIEVEPTLMGKRT